MLNTTTMKNYIILVIIILFTSCNENKVNNTEIKIKKAIKKDTKDITNHNDEYQKITSFYLPEKMQYKHKKDKSGNEKEDYQITLTNSDLLDTELENLKEHSQKIAILYYKKLNKNIISLNLRNVIVKIEHKNGKTDNFAFSEENLNGK